MSSEKYALVEGGLTIRTQLAEGRDETYDLFLDATTVRRLDDEFDKDDKAGEILRYLDASDIGHDFDPIGSEPADMEIEIGFERYGYNIYGMAARMNWPVVSDEVGTRVATAAMQQMARDLGTYPEDRINGMVYAHIDRKSGMTFETNPAASSSMDTDGMEYRARDDRVYLHAHNLYTHQMQLICISGIIALVKAR